MQFELVKREREREVGNEKSENEKELDVATESR